MPAKESIAFIHEDESAGISLVRIAEAAELQAQLYHSVDDFLSDDNRQRVDCVVLDASIPGARSFELLKQLNESKGCTAPIIMLSKTDEPEVRQHARNLGAAGFFREPMDGEALLDAIRWALCDLDEPK